MHIVYKLLILYIAFLPERYPHGIFVAEGDLATQEKKGTLMQI